MKRYLHLFRRISGVVVSAIIAIGAHHANALSWSLVDNLNPQGISNWSCWASEVIPGVSNGCEYLEGTYGLNWAPGYVSVGGTDVYEIHGATGWSDTGRPVSIDPYRSPIYRAIYGIPTIYCKASMKVLPGAYTSPDVQLEVIDAASWTYVRTKRAQYSTASDWKTISTSTWEPNAKNIFVRIGIIGDGYFARLYIDEMKVSCTN